MPRVCIMNFETGDFREQGPVLRIGVLKRCWTSLKNKQEWSPTVFLQTCQNITQIQRFQQMSKDTISTDNIAIAPM